MKFRILSISSLLLAMLGQAQADWETAIAAYQKGDYEAAHREFLQLAEQGDADAQYNLGALYDAGTGTEQDLKAAVKWYRAAAEQGYAPAQNNLGLMYDNGHGVPQDYSEAVSWYRKAAEQGFAGAQNNMGAMYYLGHGVDQDPVQAHKWFNVAVANGMDAAIRYRDATEKIMTAPQIAAAQRSASEWLQQHD